jgi:hypothetical protein
VRYGEYSHQHDPDQGHDAREVVGQQRLAVEHGKEQNSHDRIHDSETYADCAQLPDMDYQLTADLDWKLLHISSIVLGPWRFRPKIAGVAGAAIQYASAGAETSRGDTTGTVLDLQARANRLGVSRQDEKQGKEQPGRHDTVLGGVVPICSPVYASGAAQVLGPTVVQNSASAL